MNNLPFPYQSRRLSLPGWRESKSSSPLSKPIFVQLRQRQLLALLRPRLRPGLAWLRGRCIAWMPSTSLQDAMFLRMQRARPSFWGAIRTIHLRWDAAKPQFLEMLCSKMR